jgi:hypothetical protein
MPDELNFASRRLVKSGCCITAEPAAYGHFRPRRGILRCLMRQLCCFGGNRCRYHPFRAELGCKPRRAGCEQRRKLSSKTEYRLRTLLLARAAYNNNTVNGKRGSG